MAEPRRRKSAEARKSEIIDTALRLSAEIGPDRVTTQHLADSVGVTQPAIFRHFATKADIWFAVADRIVADCSELFARFLESEDDDPHAALHRITAAFLTHVQTHPAVPAILFSTELHSEHNALRDRFATMMDEPHQKITRLVERAQADGHHHDKLDAEDTAHILLATLQGLIMRWNLEARGFDLVAEGRRIAGSLIDSLRA